MNIEELELSLRTEFEGQMRNVLAGVRQEVAAFQESLAAQFDEHRAKLDEKIQELSVKLPESSAFDASFSQSVSEHLKLARDEGAQVAATAFGEAEKLKVEEQAMTPAGTGNFDRLRDATSAISSKGSQATILQSLVEHAAYFAPRGAFFIVKNDHLVGWKTFGNDAGVDDGRVREVHFASSANTVLSSAVRSMSVTRGQHAGDGEFLEPIGFRPVENAVAVPLMARGRGVAVLYADASNGGDLNVEALETLVRVAGLTVELLAATQSAPAPVQQPVQNESSYTQETAAREPVQERVAENASEEPAEVQEANEPAFEVERFAEAAETGEIEESNEEVEVGDAARDQEVAETVEEEQVEEYVGEVTFEAETAAEEEVPQFETFQPVADQESFEVESQPEVAVEDPEPVTEFAFSSNESFDASEAGSEEVEEYTVPMVEAPVSYNGNGNGNGYVATHVAEPVVEVATAQPKRSRLSERNMDLPIEVADEERRLHNDARRFARLLVSEIKLYNEQKVTEGREANDLYERLREAIDRSREMYDKRVQPAVASKFDYFHYELVNSLAEGQDAKLGAGYKGAMV